MPLATCSDHLQLLAARVVCGGSYVPLVVVVVLVLGCGLRWLLLVSQCLGLVSRVLLCGILQNFYFYFFDFD